MVGHFYLLVDRTVRLSWQIVENPFCSQYWKNARMIDLFDKLC